MNTIRRSFPLATLAAIASPLLAHEADNFKLRSSDGAVGDRFGAAVAIDGTVAVVAAPMADGVGVDSGAVYVFSFDGVGWNEVTKLTAPDAAAGAHFGTAVSINGNRLLVGAPGANAGDGSAYAFEFDGLSWGFDAVLAPAGLAAGAGFGSSLEVDGNTAVVGAPNASAAYVFVDGASWMQEGALSAAGGVLGDGFGTDTTINGNRIAVGAPHGNGVALDSGVVNIFTRSAGLWSQGQTLALPIGSAGDLFGLALDMHAGNELLIGIPGFDVNGPESGGGQLWALESGTWVIKTSYPGRDADDQMGTSIALNQRTHALGVAGDDDEALDGGTTYRFLKNSITPLEVWVGHDNEAGDAFGTATDVASIWSVNGAPGHDGEEGAAYIHSTVQTVVTNLPGSGLNPNIMVSTSGPVIGENWNVSIDLSAYPTCERTALVMKKVPLAVPLTISFGEVFFALNAPTILRHVALGDHNIAVPSNVAILDNELTLMGIIYGPASSGFPILALTNGETVVVGTTDFPVNEEEHGDE